MHLLYAVLVWLSLSYGFDPKCPGRCSCDSMQSVQCYRLTEVPSGIPSTTKKLYISHSRIQRLQVTIHSALKLLQFYFVRQCERECVAVKLNLNNKNLKVMVIKFG